MKIAFISYEYPPDTADGGIATYVYQSAKMLSKLGHQVEVFAGSRERSGSEAEAGVITHRVKSLEQQDFAELVGRLFAKRHGDIGFDVLEGPDYAADAREAVRLVPEIPFVLKLHTPSILLLKLNYDESYASMLRKSYWYVASLFRRIRPAWGYSPMGAAHRLYTLKVNEIERSHAVSADEIASPSRSLGKLLVDEWGLDAAKVSHVPYPYIPCEELLKIPVDTQTNTVTFIGRLEIRKGVIDLAQAIPQILQQFPNVRFRFVGAAEPSPDPRLDMRQYLEKMLRSYSQSIEFTGVVAPKNLPDILANTDICVFPSLWENFPCVCLEAMAAGRGIVGTNAGGMADMLNTEKVGRLIPPHNPEKISQSVIELLANPNLRMQLGQAARDRLLTEYSAESVSALQETSYLRAIKQRQSQGARFRQHQETIHKTTTYAE
ncbi:glycosyltransferase family 4 protein [Cylindrospermum sp. FACHB-282]|uniref:glycosyltransferase family 4 protein n=1 Tax=Cylindrospermum sp. FACHB-282 TaxID=2692794 RepID=UPI001688070A|nr:glycosyltransferase family 4 protein [Cylindrospermum sp. FACHB-282]MBD2387216.1 glycosyltransferase family 4 protein [Cylindrospermum sp. FACHB-282]